VTGHRLAPALAALTLVLAALPLPAQTSSCPDWVARTVSAQGRVETRRAGQAAWLPVMLEATHCPGDAVRLGPLSRAALALRDGAILRLDQNTTITFTPPAERAATWIELLTGAVHFWSRTPRGLRITTPFVNGSVEGTEFLIEVDAVEARVSVWEGRILAENPQGSLILTAGQAAVARAGQPPMLRPIVVRPTDAVAWALYYPPVLDLRPEDFPDRPGEAWPSLARRSIEEARRGDLAAALASAAGIPDSVTDPRVFTHRAALLLAVGRVDEALPDIDRALRLAPQSGDALALRAVVAVTKNDTPGALALAERAVQSDPGSAAAHLALSYARQAAFDLEVALKSAQEAVRLQPGNALAHARLAELWLSLGNLDRAQEAATEGARLDPASARAQTVLGFTALTRIRRREAAEAFDRAIALDPGAPLPRVGRGLTRIRGGDLAGGRQELEIAVSLDPGDSLLRSYLGKAYYEERRPALAADQFRLAQDLDPNDPTPWLYDAIRLQSVNRPVEALQSLQRSIELNDNRAVYRSRLQVDEDATTRRANQARIYDDLGFQQRALVEGWLSVNTDPASDSAHRFLADVYAVLPRHDTARVSELFQSQLLAPINVLPVQPQLALNNTFILARAGPADPGFGEWNSLFTRNGLHFLASGLVGGDDTWGDQVVVTGIWDRLSVSVGQLHYQTDGFRPNNDLEENVYQVFAQFQLSTSTSVLAEYRHRERETGDLPLRFDPTNFEPDQRDDFRTDSVRFGIRHVFNPASQIIGSFLFEDAGLKSEIFGTSSRTDRTAYNPELQYLFRGKHFSAVAGVAYFESEATTGAGRSDTDFANGYIYTYLRLLPRTTFTAGASVDSLSSPVNDTTQFNPKLGVIWNPIASTTVRAAVLRALQRPLIGGQAIEPTQVAGFNQLFDDAGVGGDTWRYGVAVDQRLSRDIYIGAEYARRDLEIAFEGIDLETGVTAPARADWTEDLVRAYLYWAPTNWLALTADYLYERLRRPAEFPGSAEVVESDTHRFPLGMAIFTPWGFTARVRGTYVDQQGVFGDFSRGTIEGSDRFWILDASLSYRLPKRWGLITLEGRNLLDQRFRYNDTDFGNPTFYPDRLVLLRLTFAF
jgi:tetratricopeptide (TPR) repeat protein